MSARRKATISCRQFGFSLMELMLVITIVIIVAAFIAPAFTFIKSAGDVTNAAYTIKGVLEQARTHAMANDTYTWVGFYEEDASKASTNPATVGPGRVVISTVASRDGTRVYDPNSLSTIDPTRIYQVNKLIKLEGIHLATFSDGSGTGSTFNTRPPALYNTARIGDTTPPAASLSPFQYPVASPSPAPSPQYTFVKAVEFSPRGEARINNTNYTLKTVCEIGIRPTHGTVVDTNSANVVAVQFRGFGGNFQIYRP